MCSFLLQYLLLTCILSFQSVLPILDHSAYLWWIMHAFIMVRQFQNFVLNSVSCKACSRATIFSFNLRCSCHVPSSIFSRSQSDRGGFLKNQALYSPPSWLLFSDWRIWYYVWYVWSCWHHHTSRCSWVLGTCWIFLVSSLYTKMDMYAITNLFVRSNEGLM